MDPAVSVGVRAGARHFKRQDAGVFPPFPQEREADREDARGRGDGRLPGDRPFRVAAVRARAVRTAPVGVLVADVVARLQCRQDERLAFLPPGRGGLTV